jgi:hypothetical protein
MTAAKLASYENGKYKAIDSHLDPDTHYFINSDGLWWVSGDMEMVLRADIAEEALKEALEVWRLFGKKWF